MKIGVNARMLTKPFTGIGQYTKNLVSEMAKLDKNVQWILVVPEPVDGKVARCFGSNVTVRVVPEKKVGTAGMKKTYWEQVMVPRFFMEQGVDVAFFPYPSNPWSAKWKAKGIKTMVTVHDTIPWEDKRYARGVMSRLYHGRTCAAVKKADVVLSVSGVSAEDVVRVCGVDEKKIHVVYNDAGEAYKEPVDVKFASELLGKLSLKSGAYFLYVGGYDARKNVKLLVEAFKGVSMPLVMVGARLFENKLYKSFESGSGALLSTCDTRYARLFNSTSCLGSGNIVRTGFIEDEKLAALYSGCRAFVNISEKEGFNIPILEAANQGAALIISDIPVHREVAEDKAYFVDGKSVASVRAGVEAMMDDGVRAQYAAKARELARKYSWKKYAQLVFNMLHGAK